jgi:hypothetical protein
MQPRFDKSLVFFRPSIEATGAAAGLHPGGGSRVRVVGGDLCRCMGVSVNAGTRNVRWRGTRQAPGTWFPARGPRPSRMLLVNTGAINVTLVTLEVRATPNQPGLPA